MRKKLEALGKFCARRLGIEDGSLTRSGRVAMIPDESVTIKKECCSIRYQHTSREDQKFATYQDLEHEVPRHKTEFNIGPRRCTLKTAQKPQDDRQDHHQYSEHDRGKNTGDDTDDRARQIADPCESVLRQV